jgi:hypothetical protein
MITMILEAVHPHKLSPPKHNPYLITGTKESITAKLDEVFIHWGIFISFFLAGFHHLVQLHLSRPWIFSSSAPPFPAPSQ